MTHFTFFNLFWKAHKRPGLKNLRPFSLGGENMEKVVVGIDQSLTKTGIAVMRKDTLELLEYGTIQSKSKGIDRLNEIVSDVMGTIESYTDRYEIDVVGLEQYAFNKKFSGGRVFDLGELGGVLKREIYNAGYKLEIMTVQEHVKMLLGKLPKKSGDKVPRIQKVNELYDLSLKAGETTAKQDSDIADAISIALFLAKKESENK